MSEIHSLTGIVHKCFKDIFPTVTMPSEQPVLAEPKQIREKISNKETFVANIVTDWCPDCTTRQYPHLPLFVAKLKKQQIPCYQLTVQHKGLRFISRAHKTITNDFGGHGYSRTAPIIDGEVRPDSRVDVVTPQKLRAMANDFIKKTALQNIEEIKKINNQSNFFEFE